MPDPDLNIDSTKRYIIPADDHVFIGRIFDLSIVSLNFDSYSEVEKHADCKYVVDVNRVLTKLVNRIDSLNLAGNVIWPEGLPDNFTYFPVSRYQWLTIAVDVFLMRFISVVDCVILLVNEIYETKIENKKCSIDRLRKNGVPNSIIYLLEGLQSSQGNLRDERNARFHHGVERAYTSDDATFKIAAMFEHYGNPISGQDRLGTEINTKNYFEEGLVSLQSEFNTTCRKLKCDLDNLYQELSAEFERRFVPRFRSGAFTSQYSRTS